MDGKGQGHSWGCKQTAEKWKILQLIRKAARTKSTATGPTGEAKGFRDKAAGVLFLGK